MAVGAQIVVGTSKGIILVFDYNQNLKMIIGPGTKAVESGAITALAISADHTTVAGGHANGNIFTWDTSRASRPFLTIPHIETAQAQNRTVDGHIPDVAVTHLGFLGTRHTALVSADDRGMAFSHLATRGTGALGRTVRTTRILGRYPDAPVPSGKTLKPSTVLAFGSLPLGNIERATDNMGLTAMLTPYLLVIVSTTPVAQTQHKSARPKDVVAHSALTGCLAWFPAVKLKTPDSHTGSDLSKVKLAYCWSNVLTVLDVDEVPSEDADQPPILKFKARSRWKCEEAIVAVQWLSRSVLTVLTITQRLIVLEDRTMRMTDAFDLLQRYIYHKDLFSAQLHNLVEQLDEDDVAMHGVVADAFYMSFRAYKGRLFLLGFNEVCIGALSNWADRLIAMMENGDYIGAIQLATSYYTGDTDKLTVGLPEDESVRHTIVRDKVMEIMSASLKYAFGQRQKKMESADDEHMRQLAETCFISCQSVDNTDFLFEDMYEWFEEAGIEGIFLETLESYILEGSITVVPPTVVKDLVTHFVGKGLESRLEEMICHMETMTLDLDQMTLLCKQHSLYDALTYVWNHALGDYITPMIDLLSLLVPLMQNGESEAGMLHDDFFSVNAVKIFPYLSYTLTGRVYPNEEPMDEQTATKAKAEIYWFLFSGNTIEWPKGSGREFETSPGQDYQPTFPYLRLILKYDAPSFLSSLNEAFEDSFLNDPTEAQINGTSRDDMPEEQIFGLTINRQYVLSILLDVMNPDDFAPQDTIYLDMFIARNLPKFPQYILFPGSTLSRILRGLCQYPGEDLAEDAQLSAEYLLSVFQPSDMGDFMPLFKKAGFYRILKRIYKMDKQYEKLIRTYFEDPVDQELVFDCIADCLRPNSGLTSRQHEEVLRVVQEFARHLLEISPERTAETLALQDKAMHEIVIESASDAPDLQHAYLKDLLEPGDAAVVKPALSDRELIERYVQLMCSFDSGHVSDYVGAVQSTDLRLNKLLPTMEETGVIDAAVVLMAREGQVKEAMDRLIRHLGTLESTLNGVLIGMAEAQDTWDLQRSAEDLLRSLQNFVHVGVWLCQGQTKTSKRVVTLSKKAKKNATESLSPDETLWLDLIDACVQITRRLSPAITSAIEQANDSDLEEEHLFLLLRSLVQHTFTSLLTVTSNQRDELPSSKTLSNAGANVSFLRILRAFLARAAASSPNLADLRAVLSSIFAAYAYEESILRLSNRLLERSLFVNVAQSVELRQRGWRPRGSACEACGKRVWGAGVAGGAVFGAWEDKMAIEEERRRGKKSEKEEGTGKGKSLDTRPADAHEDRDTAGASGSTNTDTEGEGGDEQAGNGDASEEGSSAKKETPLGPLVVLACRHIYHQSCLDALQDKQGGAAREREYRCPIDG